MLAGYTLGTIAFKRYGFNIKTVSNDTKTECLRDFCQSQIPEKVWDLQLAVEKSKNALIAMLEELLKKEDLEIIDNC